MKDTSLVIRICSSSVHLTVKDSDMNILFSVNERITERTMISVLSTVLKNNQPKIKNISSIDIVLSSPWIFSKTKTNSFVYPTPVTIDNAFIDTVLKEDQKSFVSLFKGDSYNESFNFDLEFVEQKVFEVKINGYHVHLKKSVPAMTLSIASTVSAMSKDIVSQITEALQHFFRHTKISFHSGLLLAFMGLRATQPENDTGIFVHTHGNNTDVTIFKLGVPTHFATVNFGTRSLARSLADATHVSLEIAESKINLFEKHELSEEENKKLEPIISKALSEWNAKLFSKITELESVIVIPKDIILFGSKNISLLEKSLANQNAKNKIIQLSKEIDEIYLLGLSLVEFHK